MYRNSLVLFALVCSLSANAQQPTIDINIANPQRTRVLNTKALEVPPSQLLWKTEKLFTFRGTTSAIAMTGSTRFSLDLPTFQLFSVPIVSNDYLYFTYVADTSYFFAIERETGKKSLVLKFENTAVSRPAAQDNTVFFGSKTGQVYAYDIQSRDAKWTFVDKDHSFADSTPMLDRAVLYIHALDRGLYAFSAETGAIKWIFKSSEPVRVPAITGDRVIVTTQTGRLASLDWKSGAINWEVGVGRDVSAPAILDDRILVFYRDGEIRAYSTSDGALKWKSKKANNRGQSLVLYKGLVYFGGREGNLIALDAATGVEKMRFKTKRPCYAPLIAGDLLYVACDDNKFYALSPLTLAEVWRMESPNGAPPPPVFADGVMYSLSVDGHMYAMK